MTGLLFLDDLAAFAGWVSNRGEEWRRGEGNVLPPSPVPPSSLVLVVPARVFPSLEPHVGWLRLARRIALVVDWTGEPPLEPELRQVADAELAEQIRTLGNVVFTAEARGDLGERVEDALGRVGAGEPMVGWTLPPVPRSPGGPWRRWAPPRWELGGRAFDPEHVRAHLSAGLCLNGGHLAVLDTVAGERLDLVTGARTPLRGLAGQTNPVRVVAALPTGEGWLQHAPNAAWRIGGYPGSPVCPGGWGTAIAVDPSGRLAWTGGRCYFGWRLLTADGPVYFTPSAHFWPDGHAKKLYGYKNNHPIAVQVARDLSATLSTYEHDVLLAAGLPIQWRDVGGYAVAERHVDEPRALFYERASEGGHDGDPAVGDEDARDAAPVVALGPGSDVRYTVGLARPTWRLRGEVGELLGGPDGGWVSYDAAHREVQRGPGRLLAGFGRWILVEREELVRRDLLDGTEERLGPAAWPGEGGAVVWGENAALWAMRGDEVWVRAV